MQNFIMNLNPPVNILGINKLCTAQLLGPASSCQFFRQAGHEFRYRKPGALLLLLMNLMA